MKTPNARKQRHEAGILQQRLRRAVGNAIGDFNMIAAGDRVMVCVSGGKDSHAMLDILQQLRRAAPTPFDLFAVLLDQGQPGFSSAAVEEHFSRLKVACRVVRQNTYTVVRRVVPDGKTYCGLCSRLRRGVLYRIAAEEGADKIALGHHADDMMEAFPIIPCNLCGAVGGGARQQVKQMLRRWEREYPGRIESIFAAMGNVAPSHLLDRRLFDFTAAAPAPATITTHADEKICHRIPSV